MDIKSKSRSLPRQTDNKDKGNPRQNAMSKSFKKPSDSGKARAESKGVAKLLEQSKASSDHSKSDVARQMDQSKALFEGKRTSKLPDQSKPVVESKISSLQDQSKNPSDKTKSASGPLGQAKAVFESKGNPKPPDKSMPYPPKPAKPSFGSKSAAKISEEGEVVFEGKTVPKSSGQGTVQPDLSNTYEGGDIFDSFPPTQLQYESIGVTDTPNVYTPCDYRSPEKKPSQKKMSVSSKKKTVSSKKSVVMVKPETLKKNCPGVKTILALVCAVVLVVALVGNFTLGVIGVTMNCCPRSVPCQVEKVSAQLQAEMGVETPSLLMNKGDFLMASAHCFYSSSLQESSRITTTLHYQNDIENTTTVLCRCFLGTGTSTPLIVNRTHGDMLTCTLSLTRCHTDFIEILKYNSS